MVIRVYITFISIGVGTMGAPGLVPPPVFSDSRIARLNFIHTNHTALAYSIGGSSIGAQGARAPPFWRATHANYIATREAHILGLSTVE